MNEHKRKKTHNRRRPGSDDSGHWLNEGINGEESLLLELDPYLFACDQMLSTLSSSVAHRAETEAKGELPFAVLVPPEGSVGWQLGYLSKKFNVYIWADEGDDFLREAADQFGAKVISGDLETELTQPIELFLFTDDWQTQSEFISSLREARDCLSICGTIGAVLKAKGLAVPERVCWADGDECGVTVLQNGGLFPLTAPSELLYARLSDLRPSEGEAFKGFVKRNRPFFGKNLRELLLSRMEEPEFASTFRTAGLESAWVILSIWESSEEL